jgi:hypothetical protein
MQTWEYLQIHVDDKDWIDSTGRSGQLPELRRGKRWGNLAPLLDELGSEGWEVAGVLNSDDSWEYQVVLKRLLE